MLFGNTSFDKTKNKLPFIFFYRINGLYFINNKIISLQSLNINSGKEEYLKYFNNCWLLTEVLFSSLKYKESFYQTPYHSLRHPLIFYYGHVASFYVNKMLLAGLIDKGINKEFENIFETGVDEMTWDANTQDGKSKKFHITGI